MSITQFSTTFFPVVTLCIIVAAYLCNRKLKRCTANHTDELNTLLKEYKKTAHALKKIQAQLHAIINQLPCDLWVFDTKGHCILQNSQASQRWGKGLNLHLNDLELPQALHLNIIKGQQAANRGASTEQEISMEQSVSQTVSPTQQAYNQKQIISFINKMAPIQTGQGVIGSVALAINISELKATRSQLQEATSFSKMFMDNMPVLLYLFSLNGQLLRWNKEFQNVTQYSTTELNSLSARQIFKNSDLTHFRNRATIFKKQRFIALEANLITQQGKSIPFYFTCSLIKHQGREAILGCGIDISDKKRAQHALSNSEERFRLAFEASPIGMGLVSTEGRFIQVNHQLSEILGYNQQEFDLLKLNQLEIDNSPTPLKLQDSTLNSKIYQTEKRLAHKQGHTVWVQFSSVLINDMNAEHSQYYLIQIADITERRELLSKLHRLAFHDPLTGLPNRKLFSEYLARILSHDHLDPDKLIALIFIDLDRFKRVNDSLGHLVGDQLLRAVAKRLKQQVRPGDMIARFAGDEFIVLLDNVKSEQEASELAHRLQTSLDKPFCIEHHQLLCKASMGIRIEKLGQTNADILLRDADIAMYRAKDKGRSQTVVFSKQMHQKAKAELDIENRIRIALNERSFNIQYQPIISLATGKIVAVEALSRWPNEEEHTDGQLTEPIEPSLFIPIAEKANLLSEHDQWVMEESLNNLTRWHAATPHGVKPIGLNINLASRQLLAVDFIKFIDHQITRYKTPPHTLGIEISETSMLNSDSNTLKILKALRKRNINIHLDDFGKGYSSLNYLYKFPVNTLKIDKAFIKRMLRSEKHLAIVRSIILLAKTQNIKVTAEGIESQLQLEKLTSMECCYGQGFLLSKPMCADELEEQLLSNRSWIQPPVAGIAATVTDNKETYTQPA